MRAGGIKGERVRKGPVTNLPMAGLSRQVTSDTVSSLITVIWLLIAVVIIYIFYRALKRIERALLDIRKLLESKS